MTPDADIDGLVRRLRERSTIGFQGSSWADLGYPDKDCFEAAALIEALRKERDKLLECAGVNQRDWAAEKLRASAAEQKLAEIAEIADTVIDCANTKQGMDAANGQLIRIAALARSTSPNGG